MLQFLSPSKLVTIDVNKNPISKGRFRHNLVCGSAKGRKKPEKKEGKRYLLKKVLNIPPLEAFASRYECHNSQTTQLAYDEGHKIINKKTVYVLKHAKIIRYFYFTELPQQFKPYMEEVPENKEKKPKVDFKDKPLKFLSVRSKSKINAKIQSWYFDEMYKNNFDENKVHFKFFTFTVTERDFDHQKTYKAWEHFLKRMYNVNGMKWHYLWVAELQTGSRNKEKAQYYRDLAKVKGIDEYWQRFLIRRALRMDAKKPTNNIHFHLLTDRYYNVELLNHYWLTALKNQGAKYQTKSGRKYNPVELSKGKKNGWQGIAQYLTKYISKNDSGLRGPLWNCNAYVSAFATSLVKMTDMSRYMPPIQMEEPPTLTLCSIEISKKVLKDGSIAWRCARTKNRVWFNEAKGISIYYFNKITQSIKNLLFPLLEFNRQVARGLSPTPFFMCSQVDNLQLSQALC